MDIKAYAFISEAGNLTVVYGMKREDGVDTYFVKISDPDEQGGWKYILKTPNWRACFQTLAETRELVKTIGYTEIV